MYRRALAAIDQSLQRTFKGLVWAYRGICSPLVGMHCRFTPTCSRYALDALSEHGGLKGSLLIVKRIGRCHPFCKGGIDPVPLRGRRLLNERTRP